MTGIILAGGRASRMGGLDKAFLKVGEDPIIIRQLEVFKKIFDNIIIIGNPMDGSNTITVNGVKITGDVVMGRGPLGGIYSGLLASDSFHNFFAACDMPFLNEALIKYIIKKSNNYDVAVPRIDGKFHPLFGVYSKNCIPIAQNLFKKKNLRISGIFQGVKVRFIPRREVEQIDKGLFSLTNVNTREELAMARKIKEGRTC